MTFTIGPPPGRIVRFWMKPLGWPTCSAAVLATAMVTWATSVPGGYFRWTRLSFLGWVVVAVAWAIRGAGRQVVTDQIRRAGPALRQKRWRWWLPPTLLLFSIGLAVTSLPIGLRLVLSIPAMNRFAAENANVPPGTTVPDRWIGLYPAKEIEILPRGFRFLIPHTGFLNRWGFAFSPNGRPQSHGGTRYRPFWRSWYVVCED